MNLAGLQKLTLLDYPGVVACIVFTQGCNLRCPFCHNASLTEKSAENSLSEEEVFDFLKSRRGVLEGVVVTGGEPLINSDIADFLKKIKELGYLIKLDTNGTNPKLLSKLIEDKLIDYVAMDIKNSPQEYRYATGVDGFVENITQSKELLKTDIIDYEFRTTVVRGIHTRESLLELAKWIAGAKRYFLQSYKNSGDILCPSGLSSFDEDELQKISDEIALIVKSVAIRKN